MVEPRPVRKYPDPMALATQGRQTSQIRDQTSSDKPKIIKVELDPS